MTTKDYLGQVQKLNKMLQDRQSDLEELEGIAESVSSMKYSKDLVISSGRQDRLENIVIRILEVEDDVSRLIDAYITKKNAIVTQIEAMDMDEYEVLRLRFIDCKPFKEIHEKLDDRYGCSERHVYRLYNKALNNFERKYGSRYL